MGPITWLLFWGCTVDVPPPPPTEDDQYNACRFFDDMNACYALRNAEDDDTRAIGLFRACEGKIRDSCRLLYEHNKGATEPGAHGTAFSGARRACQQGDREMCEAALQFADTHPKSHDMVERHRAELEALLQKAEAGPH